MPDVIEQIHGCVVQHGDFNNRVYLMQFNPDALRHIVPALDVLAEENGYAKIIAKIPVDTRERFRGASHVQEAVIPGFFSVQTDAIFIAKYLSPEREGLEQSETAGSCLKAIQNPTIVSGKTAAPIGDLMTCVPADAGEMSALYGRMFKSYPFPIQDAAYLLRGMVTGGAYCGIRARGHLVPLAAAEFDTGTTRQRK